MKSGTKIWLIIALIFALVGGGLCIAAAALGVNGKVFRTMVRENAFAVDVAGFFGWGADDHARVNDRSNTAKGEGVAVATDSDCRLEIDLDFGKLTVLTSDTDEIFFVADEDADYFSLDVDMDVISVKNVDGTHWFTPFGWKEAPKGTLYLPENLVLSEIYIDLDAGECIMKTPLSCNLLVVDLDAGSVEIENITAGLVDFDCDAGQIVYSGTADGGEADVDAGSIEINLSGADETDYNYDIDASVGNVTINKETYSGMDYSRYIDNKAKKEWVLSCDAGDITMTIKK